MFFIPDFFSYVGLLSFILCSVSVSVLLASLAILFSFNPFFSHLELGTSYECGFIPFNDSRMKFDVQFYLVAILFVIFDIEICLLLPWSISVELSGFVGFFGVFIFFFVLGLAFLVEWKSGALNFDF